MWPFPRAEERLVPKLTEPIYVDVVGDGFYDRCKARDVSRNGIGVYVRHDFQEVNLQTEVDLHITLPNRPTFKAIGQLRHRGLGKDHYYGIALLSMESHGRAMLDDYIRSLK